MAVNAVAFCSALALTRMPVDIFPNLNLPVIYVAQPYGGMEPAQMESFLVNYYEYHFLYVAGIEHVERADSLSARRWHGRERQRHPDRVRFGERAAHGLHTGDEAL